jgi:hypothetical protein
MMVAGGVAGFFAAQQEKLPVKADGAKAGAIAGGITGGLMIIGQLIGGIGILAYMQATGSPTLFGAVPQTTDTGGTIGYYIGGFGSGFCLGLIGAALAAGVGAGAGYMATPDQPASTQM